jgi:hypothetical protein
MYGFSSLKNIRSCVQIGRLVKNELDTEMAIADEIQKFKEYGGGHFCLLTHTASI